MLALTRKSNGKVLVTHNKSGDQMEITVVQVGRNTVRLLFKDDAHNFQMLRDDAKDTEGKS